MNPTFAFEHTQKGRRYFTETATYKPPKIVSDSQWDLEPGVVLDEFESDLTARFRTITRYGAKSHVSARHLVAEVFIFRPENVAEARATGQSLAEYAEHYRVEGAGRGERSKGISATVWVSLSSKGRFIGWIVGGTRPQGGEFLKRFDLSRFIRQSTSEILDAALKGDSAVGVAFFEVQMRAYI